MLARRILITLLNFLFPPIAVLMICGPGWDLLLNSLLFLAAVIPSHIHGFYISLTYFHRKGKVKKGRYPGGPKSLIESKTVLWGGASKGEVERLWAKEHGGVKRVGSRRARSRSQARGRSRSRARSRSVGSHYSRHSRRR